MLINGTRAGIFDGLLVLPDMAEVDMTELENGLREMLAPKLGVGVFARVTGAPPIVSARLREDDGGSAPPTLVPERPRPIDFGACFGGGGAIDGVFDRG